MQVSKAAAECVIKVKKWGPLLHDIGETEVKHKQRLHLFNLWTEEAGNREQPSKLRRKQESRVKPVAAAGAAAAAVAALIGLWLVHGPKAHALNVADTVILADFDNETGDTVFVVTLKNVLRITLRP